MKLYFLIALLGTVFVADIAAAAAPKSRARLYVHTQITSFCAIDKSENIEFPPASVNTPEISGHGNMVYTCSKKVPFELEIDNGQHAVNGHPEMQLLDGRQNDLLPYDGQFPVSEPDVGTGSKVARTVSATVRADDMKTTKPGVYVDTLTVTITP